MKPSSQDVIAAWDKDEVATILNALAAIDQQDLDYLLSRLGYGGRDQYWRNVVAQLRPVFKD